MQKQRKRMPSSDKTSTALSPVDGLTVDFCKKRHHVKVDETVFVEEIKKRSIIYEGSLPRSGNMALRNEAWSEVAQTMGLSIQECKKRWRSMRDGFIKQVRRKSEEDRKSWVHYRLLEFLLPFVVGKQHANVNGQGEDESDSMEYLEADSDIELVEDTPITVSYVTEDGKELFQVLHTSSMPPLPDTAVISVDKFSNAGQKAGQIVETVMGNKFSTHYGRAKFASQHENHGQAHRQQTNQYDYSESHEGDFVATGKEEQEEEDSLNTHVYEEQRVDSTEVLQQENQVQMRISETDNEEFIDEHYSSTMQHDSDLDYEDYVRVSIPERRKSCAQLERKEKTLDRNALSGYRIEKQLPAASLPGAAESSPVSVVSCSSMQGEITKETDARLGITDPDERFLMSCAPILQRLPNKKNLLARLKIQQMLYELEYDEKYNYDGSS
ncbi:uncharacterized protein LOC131210249 [Anopheles bellator]|uniref:uncharacterized protein LOC131210249 n=1 Tax=Anopheles bellator TaxID=139047 RepID=UPI002649685F|nr:uncharacterized protein LOC131210249 [Anopheles bellator]